MPAQDIFSKLTEKERLFLAQQVRIAFGPMMKETSNKGVMGDNASCELLMQQMIAQDQILRALGYQTADEGEVKKWKPAPNPYFNLKCLNAEEKELVKSHNWVVGFEILHGWICVDCGQEASCDESNMLSECLLKTMSGGKLS